jgi:hypothetical protein
MTGESDAVIELGKSLADALDASDIVGRWMAHHLADLITRSEAQPNDHELARETREVVLKFWEHNAGGRFRATPFGHLQPVLAALARLEPDPPPWAHFRTFSAEELPSADDLARYPVLEAVADMDREFGRLVRLAVALAAQSALDREEPWVLAATAVGGTEVDDVVQQLQSRVRAYRLRAALDQGPDTADEPFEPHSNELAEPAQSTSVDEKGQPNSDDEVLAIALKAAIARCTKLLESLDHLVATPEPGVVPTTPKVPDEKSNGSRRTVT